jgi:hypothetical protein
MSSLRDGARGKLIEVGILQKLVEITEDERKSAYKSGPSRVIHYSP